VTSKPDALGEGVGPVLIPICAPVGIHGFPDDLLHIEAFSDAFGVVHHYVQQVGVPGVQPATPDSSRAALRRQEPSTAPAGVRAVEKYESPEGRTFSCRSRLASPSSLRNVVVELLLAVVQ